MDFIKEHKKQVIIVAIVVGVICLTLGAAKSRAERKRAEEEELQRQLQEASEMAEAENSDSTSDSQLMKMQPNLEKSHGKAPEGFIWDTDGTLLSIGDQSMSAEDVVYAYFRGLSLLDMSTVQRYSRRSSVVSTYSQFYDTTNSQLDYTDQFKRDVFKYCLLSMQVQDIENVSVFADNKKAFSVNVKMLDLSDKTFWENDEMKIFNDLYIFRHDESDTTKSDIYLYDYISNYYKSKDAKLRDVTLNVTVQKFADLNSGWLVSIDEDVNKACKYEDGKLVVSYIKEVYDDYGKDLVEAQLQAGGGQ